MADKTVRNAPERSRIKTLTQAALNADKTVEQVEDVLDGLSNTMVELNGSLSALNSTVERLVRDGFFEMLFGPGIKAEEARKEKLEMKR